MTGIEWLDIAIIVAAWFSVGLILVIPACFFPPDPPRRKKGVDRGKQGA